jgi:hypothetical protein
MGTKLVVTGGLFLMAGFYLWTSTTEASPGYGTIALQMIVLGTGMGLTSAPATEAIIGVVPRAKAGVGSAVNDATRLLGGTLGVAVIGSVYASLCATRLTGSLPLLDAGHPTLAATLHAADDVAAGVAAAGAIIALTLLPSHPTVRGEQSPSSAVPQEA